MNAVARTAVVVLLVLAPAGCAAPSQWENPMVSADAWRRDQAACRAYATGEAERRYARDNPSDDATGTGAGGGFAADMARYEALKTRDALVAECMRGRGYVKVRGGGK